MRRGFHPPSVLRSAIPIGTGTSPAPPTASSAHPFLYGASALPRISEPTVRNSSFTSSTGFTVVTVLYTPRGPHRWCRRSSAASPAPCTSGRTGDRTAGGRAPSGPARRRRPPAPPDRPPDAAADAPGSDVPPL
eukprot:ctg_668.g318